MSALRPLPARPSLAFERKEAKALLRRLRVGDAEALARAHARHPRLPVGPADRIRLADAQLVIAREYGFASWPRLVRYFIDLERQAHADPTPPPARFYDSVPGSLLAQHRQRRGHAGRVFAAFVPRLYGKPLDEVFAAEVTEEEARLAAARMYGFPSWAVLRERTAAEVRRPPDDDWELTPIQRAAKAIESGDLDALRRVVAAHPELLQPHASHITRETDLMRMAIWHERTLGVAAMRPIKEWLETQGFDFQWTLNSTLCRGWDSAKPEIVRYLLDRGADPNWVAPNGIPVLEHALLRYWNAEAVDVLAARAAPRRALWIAAGLGDLDGVRRSLDAAGRPTRAARRLRPDFAAVGRAMAQAHPDPDDGEILLEAFFVAALNGRTAVLEYMVSRGFDVNSRAWDTPILNVAVGNGWTTVVECLLRCGADPDLKGWHPTRSAREIARELFEQRPQIAERRRIVELCGMSPDGILAERDARPVPSPRVAPKLQEALELAGDDAFRLGQADIRPENLLFGLLRAGGPPVMFYARVSRMDFERFHADHADRLRPGADRVERQSVPLGPDAQAATRAAIGIAAERRLPNVEEIHLLYALTRDGRGVAVELLARYGGDTARLNERLEKSI